MSPSGAWDGGPTFLFADLAGFTALTEAHGDDDAADLAYAFCGRMKETAPRFSASVIKSIGDAVMFRCSEPRAAVDLAVNVIEEEHSRTDFPGVRIGMNTGAATERAGDWFGAAVNVAARVSALAREGEVVLTDATLQGVGQAEHLEFHKLGLKELKNVSEPVVLYRAVRLGSEVAGHQIDPVCRMSVAKDAAAGALSHGGRRYYFCSMECVSRFAAAPHRFGPPGE